MIGDVFAHEIVESNAVLQTLSDSIYLKKGIRISMLRLDLIHPVISGNKWFKLRYHIEKIKSQDFRGIVTAGGAFSNHLHATAFAGKLAGIPTAALIRGEEPLTYSPTLLDLKQLGMQLQFMDRHSYGDPSIQQKIASETFKNYHFIPEGGFSGEGIQGASSILTQYPLHPFTHIACAVGTGTMMAGLLKAAPPQQHITGIPVLKFPQGEENHLESLMLAQDPIATYSLHYDYHQGGYAKKNATLVTFMNQFFEKHQIPLDFVYTAKLCWAMESLILQNYFPSGSNICIIHSGGLQGNRSFKQGELIY